MLTRRDLLLLGGITALAAVIRFATLDLQGFHHDEAVTAGRVLDSNFFEMLGHVESSERSPPLYYLLAWPWSKLLGLGEVGVRSLSALIGTLMVPAAFHAARELVGRHEPSAPRVGLILAAFVALNPSLVWYSQEARSYILMGLFATLALAFFARSVREPTKGSLAGWSAASALALLSHYFAIFLILGQAVWLLARSAERRRTVLAIAAVAAVGVALLPLARAQQGDDRRDGFADIALPARAGEAALNYVASDEPDPFAGSTRVDVLQAGSAAVGGAVFAAAILLSARRGSQSEREGLTLAAVVLAAGVLLPLLLAAGGLDFFNPRNLIAGVVPAMAMMAIGLGGASSGRVGVAGIGAIVLVFAAVLGAVLVSKEMQREDWRGAAEAMGSSADERLIVTNRNGDAPLAYYLDAETFDGSSFPEGVAVSEILALSTNFNVTPPRGFKLVDEQGLAPLFLLSRFESRTPRVVLPTDLRGDAVLSERSAVLFDPGQDRMSQP